MQSQFRIRIRPFRLVPSLILVLLMTLLLSVPVWADEEEGAGGSGETGAATADGVLGPYDDGGNWELGIHGTAGDLTAATAAERTGMSFWLAPASNWTLRYSFAESTAWERDFKRSALGGTENSYLDSVDLQFYVGHGWPGGFTFANPNYNDSALVSNDCYRSWGDRDNEWLALTSCQVLADSNLSNWAACMNGQHLIMGFVTNASAYNYYASTQAYHFGRYIRYNYTMPQAWYKACDVAQRGRITRTIINELDCLNDRPNSGYVCADSYDYDWWYQTHSCGTETAVYVPADDVTALPVFRMTPYSLDDATEDFQRLGDVFSIPVTPTLQAAALGQEDDPFFVSTDSLSRTLEMDKSSGIFNFSDLSELWTAEQARSAMEVSAASPNFVDNDEARRIADQFLQANNLGGEGAVFYEVISDTISSSLQVPEDGAVAASLDAVTETPLVWQVIYSRRIISPALTAAGVTQDFEFSVVGPGAKQKVYVPVAGEVDAAGVLQTTPVGVQGGWRSIEPVVDAATGDALLVTILTPEQIQTLYTTLLDRVTLNDLPLEIESREVLSYTIAYWEEATGVSQGEMIPVYELKVKLVEANSGDEIEEFVYVPASPLYMRPYARILDAPTEPIQAGTTISLTAADASQTLQALGEGNFDFVLGSGQPEDYTYDWLIDGEVIATGQTLNNFTVPFSQDERNSTITIELRVTDVQSPNQSSATDKAVISAVGIFLPFVDQ